MGLGIRTTMRWTMIASLGSVVVPLVIGFVSLAIFSTLSDSQSLGEFLATGWSISAPLLIPWAVLVAVVTRKQRRRLNKVAQGSNFDLCPACEYAMTGAASDACCPECGRVSTRESRMGFWRDLLGVSAA